MGNLVYIKNMLKDYLKADDEKTFESLDSFAHELLEKNKDVNLTSLDTYEEVVINHFEDSLVLLGFLEVQGKKMADIGSGAGFPGLPLAIVEPELELTSIETTGKKADFQKHIAETLGLSNVEVINGRVEEIAHDVSRETFDICVSRAVADLSVLCEYCLPLLKNDGLMVAYKGKDPENEAESARNALAELGGSLEKIEKFEIEGKKRSLIFIRKTGSTPSKYPRKAGIPAKRPL